MPLPPGITSCEEWAWRVIRGEAGVPGGLPYIPPDSACFDALRTLAATRRLPVEVPPGPTAWDVFAAAPGAAVAEATGQVAGAVAGAVGGAVGTAASEAGRALIPPIWWPLLVAGAVAVGLVILRGTLA